MTRAPISGIIGSGRTKVSPNMWLKRWAMSRESSTCCFWSSPTGTSSALYRRMSQAIRTGYASSPVEMRSLLSERPALSLYCVMRSSQPSGVTQFSSQHASEWAVRWLWTKMGIRSGLRPDAMYRAATPRVR